MIDEPELNLHPSLQAKFLQALGEYASEGVFYTTHSYGLARSMSDYRYVVTKDDTSHGASTVKEMEKCVSLSATLGELTYSGYLEMGMGDIILVEGSTSIKVLLELLQIYGKRSHFIPVPLGGNDMIRGGISMELGEIKRLAGTHRIYSLVDSEKTSATDNIKKEVSDFKAECEKAGITCLVLNRRAIENYFPNHAVKAALGEKYTQLSEFQLLKDAPMSWGKPENWRIARNLTKKDLDGTDLGSFLEQLPVHP
jgi:hypothetical protein